MTHIHWTQGPKASSSRSKAKGQNTQAQSIEHEVEFHPAIKLMLVCGLSASMWAVVCAAVVRLWV